MKKIMVAIATMATVIIVTMAIMAMAIMEITTEMAQDPASPVHLA